MTVLLALAFGIVTLEHASTYKEKLAVKEYAVWSRQQLQLSCLLFFLIASTGRVELWTQGCWDSAIHSVMQYTQR